MTHRISKASAFSLVEVTLAIGIAAVGLIAVFGLLPTGLKSNETSIQQTVAANLATGIAADLRQTPTAGVIAVAAAANKTLNPVSPQYGIDLTKSATKGYVDETGALTSGTTLTASSVTSASHYQVNITIINPPPAAQAAPPVRMATLATIQISWPAPAPLASAAGSITTSVALDRN